MSAAFSPLPPITLQQADDALHRIPADIPRNEWAAIAAALRGEFGDVAFDALDRWSSSGETYNRADARDTWKSAGKRSCSIGTLLFHAKQYGWTTPRRYPLTPSERARIERETIEAQRAREACNRSAANELALSQAAAAKRAAAIWDACVTESGSHPYLVAKKISAHGARRGLCDDAEYAPLVVPMRNVTGMLCNLQFIAPNGEKRFMAGGRVTGCYFALSEPMDAERIVIAEGFGTAGALAEHHAGAVIAAFSAGQLLNVGTALATRYPDAALVIAADFDSPEGGNGGPGLAAATKAANALGAELWVPVAIPGRDKTDFSDWHLLQREREERRVA